ncbi:membrane-spanning 4-domains subfamily A member 4A-like [Ciona intestinalis]
MQQTQGYINQPMSVPLIIQPPQEQPGQKYAKVYFGLGITQLVMGILSLGIAITALCMGSNYYSNYYFDTGAGIWCGVFFLICGILGCISGQKPGKCIIVASMVMTIISAVIATTMLSLETTSALLVDPYGYEYGSSGYQYGTSYSVFNFKTAFTLVGV